MRAAGTLFVVALTVPSAYLLSAPPGDAQPTGDASAEHMVLHGDQALVVSPIGNGITTRSSLVVQGRAVDDKAREFLVTLGMSSDNGTGKSGTDSARVTLYTGMDCTRGSTDCWSQNPLLTAEAGYQGYGHVVEADLNNFARDAAFGNGTRPLEGITVTGAGTFLSTYAFGVEGPPGGLVHDGFMIPDDSVKDHSFDDLGDATVSLNVAGRHLYGLDTQSMEGRGAIHLGRDQAILGGTAAGRDATLLRNDDGAVHLGQAGQAVELDGELTRTKRLVVTSARPPARSASSCQQGEMTYGADYLYVCVRDDTWRRAALSSF